MTSSLPISADPQPFALDRKEHFAFSESQHEHTDVRQVPIPVHSHEENEA